MKVDEEQTDLVHFSAKTFAGQPVGELVPDYNADKSYPGQRQATWPIESGQTEMNFLPTDDGDTNGEQNRRYGVPRKLPGEDKAQPGNDTFEELIRIEQFEAEIKNIPTDPGPGVGRRTCLSLLCRLRIK